MKNQKENIKEKFKFNCVVKTFWKMTIEMSKVKMSTYFNCDFSTFNYINKVTDKLNVLIKWTLKR